jgi:hypothetical protein
VTTLQGWPSAAGLPDGIFLNQNPNLGKFLEGLRMKNVAVFYAHMEYIKSIWDILWSFGNFVVIWYAFQCNGLLCQEKSGSAELSNSLVCTNILKTEAGFLS